MKLLAQLLPLLLAMSAGATTWRGKLDLAPDPAVFTSRSFTDAPQTLSGIEKPLWSVYADGYKDLGISPFVGWKTASRNNRVLGGIDFVTPLGGGLYTILTSLNAVQGLPVTLGKLLEYSRYVQTGVAIAWDFRYIRPAFIGYKLGVAVPFGRASKRGS